MYSEECAISLKNPLSSFASNLSCVHFADYSLLLAAHSRSISLIEFSLKSSDSHSTVHFPVIKDSDGDDLIVQAKLVKFEEITLVVVKTLESIKIYRRDGMLPIFNCEFEMAKSKENTNISQGIAIFRQYIYCAHQNGSVLNVVATKNGSKLRMKFGSPLKVTENSVTDLHANEDYIVVGDSQGFLTVCNQSDDGKIKLWIRFDGDNGIPITAVKLFGFMLIAARSTGHVRIYDLDSKCVLVDIVAHSKWISSLDICEQSNLILSCSEDFVVRLWKFPADKKCVNHYESILCPNILTVGATFLDPFAKWLAVSGYDSTKVHCFRKVD